jgi:hypothetical protein
MTCENPACKYELRADHVTLVTTKHVRRFCSVECLVESHKAHLEAVAASPTWSVRDVGDPVSPPGW